MPPAPTARPSTPISTVSQAGVPPDELEEPLAVPPDDAVGVEVSPAEGVASALTVKP